MPYQGRPLTREMLGITQAGDPEKLIRTLVSTQLWKMSHSQTGESFCLYLLLSIELEIKPKQKYNCFSAITKVNLTECFNEKNIFQSILIGGMAWFCNF